MGSTEPRQGGHGVVTPVPGLVQVQCHHHHRGLGQAIQLLCASAPAVRWRRLSEPLPWGREAERVVSIFVGAGPGGVQILQAGVEPEA